jgi:hypothetical protein
MSSWEILKYPLEQWILSLSDDVKVKSALFDILGDPDIKLSYHSSILYNIDDEKFKNYKKYTTYIKLEEVEQDSGYIFNIGEFSKCLTVMQQLTGILKAGNDLFKKIVSGIKPEYCKLLDLDNFTVKLGNQLCIRLVYEGENQDLINKCKKLPFYGYRTYTKYDDDSDSDSSDDENTQIKNALDMLLDEST